jgi:hypothetical protein
MNISLWIQISSQLRYSELKRLLLRVSYAAMILSLKKELRKKRSRWNAAVESSAYLASAKLFSFALTVRHVPFVKRRCLRK